jgi:hypothetical protein
VQSSLDISAQVLEIALVPAIDQDIQSLASHRGGPGPCLIGEDVDQQEAEPVAEFLDRAALGCHAVLLPLTTVVSAIGPDPVSGEVLSDLMD